MKCPLCVNDVEITSKETAHEKIKITGYCDTCDADIEVIFPGDQE